MLIDYILGGLILGAMLWVIIHLIRKRKQGVCVGCPGCGECSGHCGTGHTPDR